MSSDGEPACMGPAARLLVFTLIVLLMALFINSVLAMDYRRSAGTLCQPRSAVTGRDNQDGVLYDSVTVRSLSMNPSRVFVGQWQLARADSGTITFKACGQRGGLVVYLVDNPNMETLSDSHGYAVVLDNQKDVPESYIAAIPGPLATKHRKSRTNKGFTLNSDPSSCQQYWITYENGTLLVGEGDVPQEGAQTKLITCMTGDDNAPRNLKWFGFGTLRQDEVGINISDLRTYDAPAAGCSWFADAPRQCSALDSSVTQLTM
jgi:hypothetical protein